MNRGREPWTEQAGGWSSRGWGWSRPWGSTWSRRGRRSARAAAGSARSRCSTPARFATRIAAELKGFDLSRDLGADAARWEGHGRNTQIALAAAAQAVGDAGLFDGAEIDRTRFGVYLGSGEGQQDFPRFVDLVHRSADGGRVDTRRFTEPGDRAARPAPRGRAGAGDARRPPRGRLRGAGARTSSCLTACSASAQAIGEAAELIRRRRRPT